MCPGMFNENVLIFLTMPTHGNGLLQCCLAKAIKKSNYIMIDKQFSPLNMM